jgi:hypothetical protein
MAADRQPPTAVRQSLVRLGHLCFDDFLLLSPATLDSDGKWGLSPFSPELASDWSLALNNAPHVSRHFRFQIADCRFPDSSVVNRQLSVEGIHAAQQRLVTRHAYDLLRAKAPPLYDSLPWHDWDFSIVTKRFKLWQTRFLLAGDGTTVAMCRCRKSAGVYVVEPNEAIARYTERKAALEKVRRFQLLRSVVSSPGPKSLVPIPLPDNSVDLAIVGSAPSLDTEDWKLVTRELLRISHNVLLVENSPLAPALAAASLHTEGYVSEIVEVRDLGPRSCHWNLSSR